MGWPNHRADGGGHGRTHTVRVPDGLWHGAQARQCLSRRRSRVRSRSRRQACVGGGHSRFSAERSMTMRVAIAGAGNVGRSIAAELIDNGHEVLLIDKDPREIKSETLTEAEWLLADACELSSLEEAG